jgi:prepilin-type processing-associated H-X9-DG protein
MAVVADRNPWIKSAFAKAKDFSKFDPNGTNEQIRYGNTIAHKGEGQNVLFLDSHVSFDRRSFCGVNDDNIYTFRSDPDIRRGTPPILTSQPQGRLHSLLVNDPPDTD